MRLIALVPITLALLGARPASAQVRIVGHVLESESSQPIAGADVIFRMPYGAYAGRATTDSLGRFEKVVQGGTGVSIWASHAGYHQVLTPVLYFDGRSFFEVEVRLDPTVALLAPLEVIARSEVDPSHFLDAFRHRLRTGNGVYITRAEIERQRPSYVTDLLRTIPGVDVVASGPGSRPVVQMARAAGRDCATQIFVDGFLLNRRVTTDQGPRSDVFRVDDVVSPDAVEGIEVYRGLSTIPPEFLTPDATCGVIAIWTRRGGR